jgi:MoaA/NifB/PqqE/SkfB family radical SAM enzyme
VTVSLNAATKEVHERVNRGSSFGTVLTNIEYLKQIRDSKSLEFDIIGRLTLTAESLEDIPSFIRNYRRFGFDKINFGFDKNTVPKALYENLKFKETLKAKIASELKNFDRNGVDTHRLSILGLTEMKI